MTLTVCMTEEEFAEFQAWRAEKAKNVDKRLGVPITRWFEGYIRIQNCLLVSNIEFVSDIIGKSENDFLKFRNFGRRSLRDFNIILQQHDVVLAPKYGCLYPVYQFKDKLEENNNG